MFPQKILLREKRHEGQNVYSFRFENEQDLRWRAGQYFFFTLPHAKIDSRGMFRVFTISSVPSSGYLQITTRYFGEDSSSFKRALFGMKKGDSLFVNGPSPIMDVYKADDPDQYYVFLAGGIGITPMHAIIRDRLATKRSLHGTLFYANKDRDVIFKKEIDQASEELDSFDASYVFSPKHITQEDILPVIEKQKNPIFLLSGPPTFVSAMSDLLTQTLHVPKKQIGNYRYKALPLAGGGY